MVAEDLAIRCGDLEEADSLLFRVEELGQDGDTVMMWARRHQAAGRIRRALETAESARALEGTAWTRHQRAELEVHRSIVGSRAPPARH